ncbi:hypothetical protein WDU94_005186 [Cyamophila willieti]
MSSVHSVLVNEDILFAGTQEGKVHLWNLKSFREVFTLSVSTQPILSLHMANNCILIQDKELTVSVWKYDREEGSNEVSVKEIHCLKRSEPKLSFCKCVVFTSDLESHFNKFGNVIDRKPLDPSPTNTEECHLTLYNVKLKCVECRVHLKSDVGYHRTALVDKEKSPEESLDLKYA